MGFFKSKLQIYLEHYHYFLLMKVRVNEWVKIKPTEEVGIPKSNKYKYTVYSCML